MLRPTLLLAVLGALVGCRGQISDQPPIHLNPNMDTQDKYKAYGGSQFFADGRSMRTPPAGTVARGEERADDAWYRGMDEKGEWLAAVPECTDAKTTDCAKLESAYMKRGQSRYNIFCAPCHDQSGYGQGSVVRRKVGLPPVPSYHDAGKVLPMGQVFHIISYGEREPARGDQPAQPMTMPGYASQIPVADRWAIAGYVRALQCSQNAKAEDLPEGAKGKL